MNWVLWRRWTAVTTAGELLGFVAPATVGATAAVLGWPDGLTYAAVLAAGLAEGGVLGLSQATVLRTVLPRLRTGRYWTATGAAAVLAYAVGMLPGTFGDRLTDLPVPLLVAAAAVGCVVLLCSIGTAQWLVLRTAGADRPSWVATTAAAWTAGLMVFMLTATPLWQPGQPWWLIAAIGVACGAAMAATVAALTGFAAVRLAPTAAEPTAAGPTTAGPTTAGPTTAGPTTAEPTGRPPADAGQVRFTGR